MASNVKSLAFDTGGRIFADSAGHYWAMGSDIPILAVGKGSPDDATNHFRSALGTLGRYLVNTRGLDGAADYLAGRGVKNFEIVTIDGRSVLGESFKVAVTA